MLEFLPGEFDEGIIKSNADKLWRRYHFHSSSITMVQWRKRRMDLSETTRDQRQAVKEAEATVVLDAVEEVEAAVEVIVRTICFRYGHNSTYYYCAVNGGDIFRGNLKR